jgi:hypothetical protein
MRVMHHCSHNGPVLSYLHLQPDHQLDLVDHVRCNLLDPILTPPPLHLTPLYCYCAHESVLKRVRLKVPLKMPSETRVLHLEHEH